jgi:hypothetical protein
LDITSLGPYEPRFDDICGLELWARAKYMDVCRYIIDPCECELYMRFETICARAYVQTQPKYVRDHTATRLRNDVTPDHAGG